MDAKSCWVVSIVIHATLLFGAAVMALGHYVLGDPDGEGSGFSCSVGDPTAKFESIARPKDVFAARIPSADGSDTREVYTPGGILGDDRDRWYGCCECGCGGAATTMVAWPKDIVGYFDRKLSLATNRKGVPRLKTHGRPCAFRESGLEADCTCGLIPPKS